VGTSDLSEGASAASEFVRRVASAIGADVTVSTTDREDVVTVTCSGADLGLFIGKHGQTIDAVQYLANAIVRTEGGTYEVVVDAAGYRARRRATLEAVAERSARRAATSGQPVELDPMTSIERKIVHEALKDDDEVETRSEGSEPNRFVVVAPRG
jgi:spoIIIJ-associated protein